MLHSNPYFQLWIPVISNAFVAVVNFVVAYFQFFYFSEHTTVSWTLGAINLVVGVGCSVMIIRGIISYPDRKKRLQNNLLNMLCSNV